MRGFLTSLCVFLFLTPAMALKINKRINANIPHAEVIQIDGVKEDTKPEDVARLLAEGMPTPSVESTSAQLITTTLSESIKILENSQGPSAWPGKEIQKIKKFTEMNEAKVFLIHAKGRQRTTHVYVAKSNNVILAIEQSP